MKQYVGISRDHSGSMGSLKISAVKDYNLNVDSIKEGSNENGIDTVVSVIKCGSSYTDKNKFEVINSSVNSLKPLSSYSSDGGMTPLFDSVGDLVEQLSKVPDANEENVSFLVMVITDGEENASRKYSGTTIGNLIKKLQATDRWTFVFRVPKGYASTLTRLGIPEGNILEWDQTAKGFEKATEVTRAAVRSYYQARATGVRSTERFYSDLSNVTARDLKELKDITNEVTFWPVRVKSVIREFVESRTSQPLMLGRAFYQLNKPEKVQGHKILAIRNKKTGEVYAGDSARDLLGIPHGGEIKLYPGNHGDYDVFIQSTSVNRNLLPNTEVLYWPNPAL